ncbi:MAG: biotin carboxylase, partial [Bacillus sp. (in: firmicutes)]
KWQILIARGALLPLLQDEITLSGHAIEFRLYAEDSVRFLPSPGKISTLNWNHQAGVRIDSGYDEGGTVTPFYDPMIAKVIIHNGTREEAVELANRFFKDIKIEGIKTNVPLILNILSNIDFQNGTYTTSFLTKKLVN